LVVKLITYSIILFSFTSANAQSIISIGAFAGVKDNMSSDVWVYSTNHSINHNYGLFFKYSFNNSPISLLASISKDNFANTLNFNKTPYFPHYAAKDISTINFSKINLKLEGHFSFYKSKKTDISTTLGFSYLPEIFTVISFKDFRGTGEISYDDVFYNYVYKTYDFKTNGYGLLINGGINVEFPIYRNYSISVNPLMSFGLRKMLYNKILIEFFRENKGGAYTPSFLYTKGDAFYINVAIQRNTNLKNKRNT